MMKIELTKFAERHFDKNFTGTKILDMTPEDFTRQLQHQINMKLVWNYEGYAPFCKLVSIRNFTDAKTGTLPLTLENYQYLRTGYSARTKNELPVLSTWLDIPRMFIPTAEYLIVVLYTREQLLKEHDSQKGENTEFELDYDTDYGIVAILGQMDPKEEPMKPITIMRNALGKEYGGSGVALDKEAYEKSVEFWKNNATVK